MSSVARVSDELEILRLLARLAQSVDDLDEKDYRECLADVVTCPSAVPHDGVEWQSVSSADYARRAIIAACAMNWTHHQVSNVVITLDGQHATGTADVVIDMQSTDETGQETRLTVGGRYELGFTKFAAGWRIAKRSLERRYVLGDSELLRRTKLIRAPR